MRRRCAPSSRRWRPRTRTPAATPSGSPAGWSCWAPRPVSPDPGSGRCASAGLLHDVGKLGVPTRVLTKKGSLTTEEFDEIRAHPLQGFDIITGIDFLDDARTAILHHHERLDGAGYPAGLSGKAIPEFSRMIAVVDAFDSMTSSRSYHHAREVSEALAELQRCAGSHFDPAFVDAFCTTVARRGWRMTEGVSGVAVNVGVSEDETADSDSLSPAGEPVRPYDHDDPTVAPPVVLDGSR